MGQNEDWMDLKRQVAPARVTDILIAKRYRIEEKLGGGAFGEVYKGTDISNGLPVAFKMELREEGSRVHLNNEYRIYRRLNQCTVTIGIPHVLFCGEVGDYTVLVMELLGPSLEELFNLCHRKFPVKTVCMMGLQIVERMQYLHTCGYLHRDIKPENFVMGIGNRSHVVYMIDVGLARTWRDSKGRHISYCEGRSLTGTARYVSINTHKGLQQSRRDDLEAVSYLLMYFLRGTLPWQGLKGARDDSMYMHIANVKMATSPEALARGFPPQFARLVEYARGLEFTSEPNYNYCTQLLYEAMGSADFDYRYQWNLPATPAPEETDVPAVVPTSSDMDRRRASRNTAVAIGGTSTVFASSMYNTLLGDSSAAPGYSRDAISVASASYANFLDDMQDTFGIGSYY